MAYLNFGGNIMKFGSSVMNSGESFVLKSTAPTFPMELDNNNNGIMILEFSVSTVVKVNYGDGTIINYTANFISAGRYQVYLKKKGANTTGTNVNVYTYADGLSLPRVVSFSFDRSKLILIQLDLMRLSIGDLLFEITKYPMLKTFNIRQIFSIVDLNLEGSFSSSMVESVQINNAFIPSSPYYKSIPSSFFLMPLKTLGVGSGGMGGSFASSKFDQIYLLGSTLNNLTIQGTPISDNHFGAGPLPSNFSELTSLNQFSMLSTNHTVIPSTLNTIPSLTGISMGYSGNLIGWGDLSNLINLTNISIASAPNMSTTLPSYLTLLTKLKNMQAQACFKTQLRVDTWVDNWYTFITTNASMTGLNTLPFRGMKHNINVVYTGDGTVSPTGTYQQPSGYVSGSNNGTPASPKEKIWVMVNQYGHTWTTL
jgi:hypothetical protein